MIACRVVTAAQARGAAGVARLCIVLQALNRRVFGNSWCCPDPTAPSASSHTALASLKLPSVANHLVFFLCPAVFCVVALGDGCACNSITTAYGAAAASGQPSWQAMPSMAPAAGAARGAPGGGRSPGAFGGAGAGYSRDRDRDSMRDRRDRGPPRVSWAGLVSACAQAQGWVQHVTVL